MRRGTGVCPAHCVTRRVVVIVRVFCSSLTISGTTCVFIVAKNRIHALSRGLSLNQPALYQHLDPKIGSSGVAYTHTTFPINVVVAETGALKAIPVSCI